MKISLNWLNKYITIPESPFDLADRLTMIGLEVEEIKQENPTFSGVFIGKVIRVEKHPSAEKLTICTVNINNEDLSVICGAPNVAEGQIVPLAKAGAVLGDGLTIEKRKIRGVVSEGMICSEKELGVGDNHQGILVLDEKIYNVGEPFTISSHIQDSILEVNVTPNRPDCLSYLGIAREVGVLQEKKFNKPGDDVPESDGLASNFISIEIQDPVACPRYSSRVMRDVNVGPSPDWLKEALRSVGLRSINNVVDITNYVLLETGHPLHAFDYDFIQGQKIIVRKAKTNEKFITLDNNERQLTADDILICDAERAIGLAGVMGGLNSEVTDNTAHVLLESAYFDPMMIRNTSKRLGLSTDASQRFERGADPNGTLYALNRAAQLIAEFANGKVTKGIVDEYPMPINPWSVTLRPSRTNSVLGVDIPKEKAIQILEFLELAVTEGDPITVTIPTFRPDLKKEIDLIEEIVRHYGYDKIEPNLYSKISLNLQENTELDKIEYIRDIFVGFGFLETLNNSLVSKKHNDFFTSENKAVGIQNPLGPDNAYLRTSLIPELLDSIQWNRNRSQSNLRLFEIGRVFMAKPKELPDEHLMVSCVISGNERNTPYWNDDDRNVGYHHLKGILQTLLARLHLDIYGFQSIESSVYTSETATQIVSNGIILGILGQIQNDILKHWDIEANVFALELNFQCLSNIVPSILKYRAIPKFPSIKRDLALIVDEKLPVASVKEKILSVGGDTLFSAEIFDLYRGKQIPAGKKSIAFTLTFLSKKSTLTEDAVDPIIDQIIKKVKKTFGAVLRF